MSAEQVQTLVQYLSGLKAPASPLKADKNTRLGAQVFEREGCGQCHTKETKLTPVAVVGTDPAMALATNIIVNSTAIILFIESMRLLLR